mmetsp:Transcript_11276/g.18667  ORF Transcript_11276/g.18667 Transcript_11276/m.18667 type:complete len:185 (-) Transcript_11276:202-756(-)
MLRLLRLFLVLLCIVTAARDEDQPWRLATSIAFQLQNSLIHVLASNDEATSKLSRASRSCSVVIVGAPWDGHFRAFIGQGKMQEVATTLLLDDQQEEINIMLLLYKGYKDGSGEDDFLPKELWAEGTLGSYEMRVFHGGIDRGRVDVRQLDVQELVNEVRSICNNDCLVQQQQQQQQHTARGGV